MDPLADAVLRLLKQDRHPAGSSRGGQFRGKDAHGDYSLGVSMLSEAEGWSASLSSSEKAAVLAYSGHDFKKKPVYEALNDRLRDGLPLTAAQQRIVSGLDSAISRSKTPVDIALYRAVRRGNKDTRPDFDFKPGDTWTDRSFVSTFVQSHAAADFQAMGSRSHVVLRIEVPAGTGAYRVNRKKLFDSIDEGEVLLPRNRRYRVRSVDEILFPGGRGSRKVVTLTMDPEEEPVAKAVQEEPVVKADRDVWARWNEWAQQLEPRLRDAFVQALSEAKDGLSVRAMQEFIERGDVAGLETYVTAKLGDMPLVQDALRSAIIDVGAKMGAYLPNAIMVRFDRFNPRVIEAVNREALQFIQQITADVRDTVGDLLKEGLKEGIGPAASARRIRQEIGLTQRQRQAVRNFRRMLEAGDRELLTRELRDRRFDRTLEQVILGRRKLTPAEIETMVNRYAERYLKHRAENIARTESIRALSSGNRAAWDQVFARNPTLRPQLVRRWYVAPLEGPSSHRTVGKIGGKKGSGTRVRRTCPICAAIPGMNENGRAFDEAFLTPEGSLMSPPVHPHCRCVVFTGLS